MAGRRGAKELRMRTGAGLQNTLPAEEIDELAEVMAERRRGARTSRSQSRWTARPTRASMNAEERQQETGGVFVRRLCEAVMACLTVDRLQPEDSEAGGGDCTGSRCGCPAASEAPRGPLPCSSASKDCTPSRCDSKRSSGGNPRPNCPAATLKLGARLRREIDAFVPVLGRLIAINPKSETVIDEDINSVTHYVESMTIADG